ncbi:Peroxisome biogenesis protein 12 [Carex littledalei]|uniref:Peroxisome biogenesis protein 12 n=1 Tax=Carex littledalei TaxID=544730 RepID=A0A833V3T8_9POAL|nr:Peroxisome biogenesis protein 12 [Carex littledalei]
MDIPIYYFLGSNTFAYQLLYLLDATAFYSQGLHALGIQMDSSSKISRIRSRELEGLRGPTWLKAMQRVLLKCVYTSLDYAQTGLIAAVFFFKMMEWWYQSAEERMSAPTVYPPPPPPPPPKGSVKLTKKNVATPDNKFTADTRIGTAATILSLLKAWLANVYLIC